MSQPKHLRRPAVALLIETSNRHSREVLNGIRDFMRAESDWAVHLTELGRGDAPPPWLAKWKVDGIIARIESRQIEQAVRERRVPVVNVSAAGLASEFPVVISDSAAVARMAAEHLLERGFEQFGYCGDSRFAWSATHGRHFAEFVTRERLPCAVFDSRARDFEDWEREQEKLASWIRSLPKPVGIMACYDIRGQQLLEVCRQVKVQVPDEVAVIGQHNDEFLCDLCNPPLSSVIPNSRGTGYEAARLLQRMMSGRRVAAKVYHVRPVGVAVRQSTDVVAVNDRQVAAVMRFIRENACQGIGVGDVLQAVPMSRTLLERKLRRLFGRSPYELILQIRLRRAKELLTETQLSVAEIAERGGFSCAEYLSAAFKRQVGMSPRGYRVRSRRPS